MKKIIYISIFAIMYLPVMALAQTTPGTVTNVAGTDAQSGSEFNTSASAETPPPYVLLAPLPCIGATSGSTCTSDSSGSSITSISIENYLIYLFKLMISLAVFLAVVMAIFGGFKYMTTEAVTGKSDAKETIENAVKGLLLALASYLILYTINPNFVDLSLVAVPKLNVATTTVNLNGNVDTGSNSDSSDSGSDDSGVDYSDAGH